MPINEIHELQFLCDYCQKEENHNIEPCPNSGDLLVEIPVGWVYVSVLDKQHKELNRFIACPECVKDRIKP